LPHYQELTERHRDRGLVVAPVAVWSEPKEAQEVLEKAGYRGLALFDGSRVPGEESAVLEAFGVSVLPHAVLLDREGRVAASLEAPSHEELDRALKKLGIE
jgi:hypothetical protein